MPKSVAIFDFDNTLITGDSFMPFLAYAAGVAPTCAAAAMSVAALIVKRIRGDNAEARTFIKACLVRDLLTGKSVATLSAAVAKMRSWQKINAPIMGALREHHANGDTIVIASGGLDLYLPEMLRDVPHHALICTDISVDNGIVTGEMVKGNCVRARKAELVAQWLAANGPFDTSWAYGNYPHDVAMMMLVKHRIIVS